ncbi:MAG: S1/P1 nuclease [Pseudomonadota bacterium]
MKIILVIVALLLVMPKPVNAWGETGHRVVCQIAYDEISDAARTEVDRLIALDPLYENFADSCLFADFPERIRWQEHFMNLPRNARSIATADCPLAQSCVLTAIPKDAALLSDGMADDQKLLAMKLLGHWVGDIHQPLHVSFQDDRGANSVAADIAPAVRPAQFDPHANLHGVWDYLIIAQRMGDDYIAIAEEMRQTITQQDRAAWRYDSPVEWADESFQITIDPSTEYCVQRKGTCRYTENNRMLNDGEPIKAVPIDARYLERHEATVRQRLKQAGIRLAVLLERLAQ